MSAAQEPRVRIQDQIQGGEYYQQSGEVFPINSSGLVAPIWTGRSLQISEISVSTCRYFIPYCIVNKVTYCSKQALAAQLSDF